jgi:hypothetical protein
MDGEGSIVSEEDVRQVQSDSTIWRRAGHLQ